MSSRDMSGTNPARVHSAETPPRGGLSARDRSRRRKWIYGFSMIVLIVVLFVLSRPATLGTKEVQGQTGGLLAQYRDKNRLSQTELGQIDPTSEMIRLATLGMRSFGETILWSQANDYQKKKDWTLLRATLDQISKFQPHSVLVWRYQAWNLSYNVSVAFDDYHDKFYWVIEGLNYLLDGVRLNDKEPRLYWDMGWFISNKIGRDDAAKYYRRLFSGERGFDGKDTPEFVKAFRDRFTPPGGFPPGTNLRDNWHVGKAWFLAAESKIDPPRYPVRGMAPVIFYSDAPTCQLYYADNLEKDGIFGQVAQRAWKNAEDEWHALGERAIDTSYDELLQLNRKEDLFDQAEDLKDQLDALAPGAREDLEKEKRVKLTPAYRTDWDAYRDFLDKYRRERLKRKSEKNEKPLLQPTLEADLKEQAEATPDEVARRAPPVHRQAALKLAKEIEKKENLAREISRERAKVNFDFWRTRARAEQTPECLAAREAIDNGDRAYAKGDMIRARPEYEKGMRGWRKVLDDPEFHPLVDDVSLGGDLADVIRRYDKCLEQDDLSRDDLPQPFVLQEVVDKHGYRQGSPSPPLPNSKKPDTASNGENSDKKADSAADAGSPGKKANSAADAGSPDKKGTPNGENADKKADSAASAQNPGKKPANAESPGKKADSAADAGSPDKKGNSAADAEDPSKKGTPAPNGDSEKKAKRSD
jgi:hypothetical protein